MRRIKLWAAVTVCGLSLVGSAFGQTKGDEVVVIVKQTDLKSGATVVETTYRGNYLTVREVSGNWLWVDNDGTRGWLQRDHVILASGAIDYFTEELQLNPKDGEAFIARAIAWKRKGELTNAIRDCDDAIAINPKRAWAYKIRGNAWMAKQEYDLAIADYDEGLRLDPKDAGYYCNRAICHHKKKNYDKAIADFTEAIRRNPKFALSYEWRGDSYCARKDFGKALADYTMSIEIDSKQASAYGARGWIHQHRLGDFDKAIADYTTAIDLAPTSSLHHNNLAWLLATCSSERHRNGTRAVELATKAVELAKAIRSDLQNELDTLAAAHAESGNFARAIRFQQQAVELASSEEKEDFASRLKRYQSGQPYREELNAESPSVTAAK